MRPRLMVRRPIRGLMLRNLEADIMQADIRSPESLDRILKGIDTVIHLGARAAFEPYPQLYPSIVKGSVNLMQAAIKAIISCLQTKISTGSPKIYYRFQRKDPLSIPCIFFQKTGGTHWFYYYSAGPKKRGIVEGDIVIWASDTKEADDIANEIIEDLYGEYLALQNATYNSTSVENIKIGSPVDGGYISQHDCYVDRIPISFEWKE